MYQKKHRKTSYRRWKTSVSLLVSLLLLAVMSVGGTVAYLKTATNAVTNTFTSSSVGTEIEEELSEDTKSDVRIQNTGDTEAYIRASVIVTWKDESDNVSAQTPEPGTDYNITFNTNSQSDPSGQWVLAADGYYYWTSPVGMNDSTGILISSCTPESGKAPEGYYLNVEILGSAIQSLPTSAVTTAWSSGVVSVSDQGTLNIKTNN